MASAVLGRCLGDLSVADVHAVSKILFLTPAWALLVVGLAGSLSAAEPADLPSQLQATQKLLDAEKYAEAVAAATQILKQQPDEPSARWLRAMAHDGQRNWDDATKDLDELIMRNPNAPRVYQQRGVVRFRAGNVAGSLEDFNAAIRLAPDLERQHWQRGLTQYLLSDFEGGEKQFRLYQDYYGADVENVVWHMACIARRDNWAQAQAKMLKLEGTDPRIPLMEVDRLFRGQGTVDQVLQAVQAVPADSPNKKLAQFYAHLYLALYADARRDLELRGTHLKQAVELKMDHYMWDVAHVWQQQLARTPVDPPTSSSAK